MEFSAKTDIGLKRSMNQDSFKCGMLEKENIAWAVVCDGMGGMAAGNIASEQTTSVVSKALEQNLSPKASSKFILNLLKTSVDSANATVFDMSSKNEELRGMGTTVIAVVVKNNTVSLVHAGDSRAYIFKDGELSQITTDHSVVQTMVESGQITQDEANHHPNKNIITRAVGVAPTIQTDVSEITLCSDDIILLCTDGLTNCVDANLLKNTIIDTEFSILAERLVDLANQNGGNDNITVVAIKL